MSLKLQEAVIGKVWEVGVLGKNNTKNDSNAEESNEKKLRVVRPL